MTTFAVPTFVTYPVTGPTIAARGQHFMLPGYLGSEHAGGVPWTDTWTDGNGKVRARNVGDVFHYWFKHWNGVSYSPSPAAPYYTPMSTSDGNTNTILFQPDETYAFDYGLKWGGDTQAVAGGQGLSLVSVCTRVDGTLLVVEWPSTALYLTANICIDLNGSTLLQSDNQTYDKPVLTLTGVLTAGSATMTNVTVPNVSAEGMTVADLIGDTVQLRVPTWDPSVGGDGGGWVFSGDCAIGSNEITNVTAKYAGRPLSTDWIGHTIQMLTAIPFSPTPPGARISNVVGTTITVVRTDNNAPFPSVLNGRIQMALDNQTAWPGGGATILSISPSSPGTGRTVVLDKTSPWNWGIAGPAADVTRALATVEPRRRNGVWLVQWASSHRCQIKNGTLRGSRPPGQSGTFTAHESWFGHLISQCDGVTIGDPADPGALKMRNIWSDGFNFSGLPYDTAIYADVRSETPGGYSTGRHMFTLEGNSGVHVEGVFFDPARWMFDTEAGDHVLDLTCQSAAFRENFGLFHIRPGSVVTPAPNFLDHCSIDEDDDILTVDQQRATWPINPDDVHKLDGAGQPFFAGGLTTASVGAMVTGPGIDDWTYITKLIDSTHVRLSKPALSDQTDVAMVQGQGAVVRGIRLYDCTFARSPEIWFHGVPSGKGALWFQGTVADGSKDVTSLVFPARPDGSPTPTWADILPSLGRTFCVYSGIFSPTAKRVVVQAITSETSFQASLPARESGTFWFYSENIPTWYSDIEIKRCTGPGIWGGKHFSDTGNGSPAIELGHLTGDVEITDNVCVARLGTSGPSSGQPVETMVGTTKQGDRPMWPPPAEFGPKNDLGVLLGPPWSPGDPAWTVTGNRWLNALDNQITTTVAVSFTSLTLDATLDSPGQYSALDTDPIVVTSDMIGAGSIEVPGIVTFLINGVEVGTDVASAASVATLTIPPLAVGVYVIGARFDGTASGSTAYLAAASSTVTLTVGVPPDPPPVAPDVSLDIDQNPATTVESVTITVTVDGNYMGHPPTGDVEVVSDLVGVLASGPVDGVGEFTWIQTFTPGVRNVYARFLGDTYNAPAQSDPEQLAITAAEGIEIRVGVVVS